MIWRHVFKWNWAYEEYITGRDRAISSSACMEFVIIIWNKNLHGLQGVLINALHVDAEARGIVIELLTSTF